MTAFGRLWARAPAWRAALMLTIGCGTLAVVFPPGPNQIAPPLPPVPVPVIIRPEPAPATQANMPVPGQMYSNLLPFGAQSVPLPSGRWQAISVADAPNASAFMALVLNDKVAAAALISGSTTPEPQAAGFRVPADAQIPTFYYRRILAAVDHGRADFWLCGSALLSSWTDPTVHAAITVLAQQHIAVSDRFDSAVFRFSDKRNWLAAEFLFPVAAKEGTVLPWTQLAVLSDAALLPHIEKVRRWGKAWHDVLRRGFDGRADLPSNARIPLP